MCGYIHFIENEFENIYFKNIFGVIVVSMYKKA